MFQQSQPVVFGLAFDIEKTPEQKSGFKPARIDLGAGKELFGDLRLDGFASLLRLGFAEKLAVVGGIEGRYKGENISRAKAICEMLEKDLGIPHNRLEHHVSGSNTGGNIEIILKRSNAPHPIVTTNHYHCPRAFRMFREANRWADAVPAEAFWLLEDLSRKNLLIQRLGDNPLAERDAEEIQGIAQLINKTYQARTDIEIPTSWWQKVLGR